LKKNLDKQGIVSTLHTCESWTDCVADGDFVGGIVGLGLGTLVGSDDGCVDGCPIK
jgi:hypothetical protein